MGSAAVSLPTRVSHVGGNVNNNVKETSEAPAVCEISKQYSSRCVCLRQKCTRVTLPRKTSTGEALETCLWGFDTEELQDVRCRSCSLFKDRSKARGIVGGISKTPCATQAIKPLIVVLH